MKHLIMTLLLMLLSVSQAISSDDSTTREKSLNSNRTSEKQLSFMLDEFSETPHDGKICNSIGFYFYKLGKYQAAMEYYKEAITLSPEYPVSYNNLGVVYLKENQLQLAKENFKKAIELDTKYVKAICNIAVVYFKLSRYEEAQELYSRAKFIDPEYVNERVTLLKNKIR